jgi:NADH:ubiquinone oxidoreductase subunit 5 (subunit L)/multisubunit Na+/H+ antiporter MnhA subunit
VDEFYNWLIVEPLRVGSEKILWQVMDSGAIDEFGVNGSARATVGVGSMLRLNQSGNLRSYASSILLAAVISLGYTLASR